MNVENTTSSENSTVDDDHDYPLHFRVFATIIHLVIFICGVSGNIIMIVIARRAKSLQSPTYCYLISLAFADLVVLLALVPEAIVFHHVGRRWLAGQAGCSLFIFANFLGINAGSTSILAFTVERYIAIVSSLLAKQFCTIERTKKVIVVLWIVVGLYCSPWLALTEVKPDPLDPQRELCDFRFWNTPEVYMSFFAVDFLLFYFLPLAVAVFVYTKITIVLRKSSRIFRASPVGSIIVRPSARSTALVDDIDHGILDKEPKKDLEIPVTRSVRIVQSREQVLPMLIATVCLFAIAWLPFRGLLIYNSIVEEPWLDIWYLLFAKTLIYMNSAMNPLLYNAMSKRFRVAFLRAIACKTPSSHRSSQLKSFQQGSGNRNSFNLTPSNQQN